MAALTSIAALVGAGASVYGSVRQAQQAQANAKAQAQIAQSQGQSQQQELLANREAQTRERQAALSRTIATTRARLAAGGLSPDEGSAAAITAGLIQDAAAAEGEGDAELRARLARGRTSLLSADGTFTAALSGIRPLGNAVRGLLD